MHTVVHVVLLQRWIFLSWLLSAPSSHLDSNYCDYTAIFKSLHWLIPQHDHLFSSQEELIYVKPILLALNRNVEPQG